MSMLSFIKTSFSRGTQVSRFNVMAAAALGAPAHLLFYVAYKYIFQLEYDSIILRLIAVALCLGVLFKLKNPDFLGRFFPVYWHTLLIFVLPFILTVMVLKNNFHEAWLYWEMGKKEQAQQILEELKKQSEDGQQVPWGIAWINMGLDDFENAIAAFDKSLEESIDNGWFGNFKYFIHAIDDLKVLHSYPRFQALLEKVNSTKI